MKTEQPTKRNPTRQAWVTRDQIGDRLCQLWAGVRPIDDMGEWFASREGFKWGRPMSCYLHPTMAKILAGRTLKPGEIVAIRVNDCVVRKAVPSRTPKRPHKTRRIAKRLLKVLRVSA